MITLATLMAMGFGSMVSVELVRDSYHVLSHTLPPLSRLHAWHHRVFRPDYTPTSDTIYRQAHWYHDVPEATVMVTFSLLLWWTMFSFTIPGYWGAGLGCFYASFYLVSAVARASGVEGADQLTDLTHLPGPFTRAPAPWLVNQSYHWRHHFDNQNAYYCGVISVLDRLMGTALSLKGKKVAVTGASGSLGRSLLSALQTQGAKVIALTSSPEEIEINGSPIKTIVWQVGQESELALELEKIDILILNHGINVHGARTEEAISRSYEVNAFSSWRLLELFLATVKTNEQIAKKEVWVNTSEAEVNPAFSPLYELSKRTLGDLVTLRRLDAPCVIRKLILGPFKSNLNPIGIMSAEWVGKQIVNLAQRDVRNIVVTVNPLTMLSFPVKEFFVSSYFKLFSKSSSSTHSL